MMDAMSEIVAFLQGFSQDFGLSRWIFLRLLGLIYGVAFLSLIVQVRGLIGEHGILPVTDYLDYVKKRLNGDAWRILPTVFWMDARDRTLLGVCALGLAASFCLTIGFLELPCLILLFISYLSLTIAGQDFLSFQWDILLIETGFLAIFLTGDLSPVILLLFWWLLFRLMFESGAVKLSCGDETWRHLTALDVHYETQPLPHRVAWYAHQLPRFLQKISVGLVLVIEILLPFFIFLPPPFRWIAALGLVLLMVLIFFTGNYNFFNLLTLALCALLIDDSVWLRLLPASLLPAMPEIPVTAEAQSLPLLWLVHLILALVILIVSLPQVIQAALPQVKTPGWMERLQILIQPFHLINSYGLFRHMTVTRPEIIIEGSMDGVHWKSYEFRYKPGDLRQPPRFVAPHQPRLDWQMWFAALSSFQSTLWFQSLLIRLLEGSPEVLRLLKHHPFEGPPRYIRALLYDYKFTTLAERKQTGDWWKRTLLGRYSPTLMRRDAEENSAP
ncbi:lipase maturation factor family protein [Oligoflexus tunisiensis]|uniref:lipase maturation factor family protein n=1 Tax=Oligoflexus tunisiensis TaxID=708132 RepID=UPI000AC2E27B|nr:lipase maturation factor family protein [Oligoflexus tunisiensis]